MKKLFICFSLAALLAGCAGVEEEVPVVEEETPVTEYETYSNEAHGVEFTYPSGWLIEDSDSEGGLQAQASNMQPWDGPGCQPEFAELIVLSTVRDTEMDFDDWVESRRSDVAELGRYGGEIEKMEFPGGYPAYKIEKMGWETGCDPFGYIVDYSEGRNDGRLVEVVVARDENDFDAVTQTDEILNNITLSGSRL